MAKYVKISVIGAAMCNKTIDSGRSSIDQVIAHLHGKLDQVLPDQPDLIVLPEFCDMCGSDTIEQYRESCSSRGSRVFEFLAEVARQHRTWITYPALQFTSGRSWKNSVQLINRHGQMATGYDKVCLTIGEMEAGGIPGEGPRIVETEFGRVAMIVCFDLNFDELRKQVAQQSPDLILFSSMYHGGLMQEYWAYSCRAHFAAAVTGLPSRVISPVGQTIATTTNYVDHVTTRINLDCRVVHLDYHAEKLRDLKRKYGPGVRIHDPGLLAPVLVSSESDAVSTAEMLREFEIELLDDYLNRCRGVWSNVHGATSNDCQAGR